MKICDICGRGGVQYDVLVITNELGNARCLDLCGTCYDEFRHKEKHYRYLAYAEVVEERTGKSVKKSSLIEKLKSVISW